MAKIWPIKEFCCLVILNERSNQGCFEFYLLLFSLIICVRSDIIISREFLPLFYFNNYKFKKKVLKSLAISLFSQILSAQCPAGAIFDFPQSQLLNKCYFYYVCQGSVEHCQYKDKLLLPLPLMSSQSIGFCKVNFSNSIY